MAAHEHPDRQHGEGAEPSAEDREKAMRLLLAIPDAKDRPALIAQALADAREEGRQSVGLGYFVVDECDEETPVPSTWHDDYGYGYLECTLRKGHDGEHEHQESGLTWVTES